MSIRAMYTFTDEAESHNVYKHHDGYPVGGVAAIREAIPFAWEVPRFEADEFAAAFVAANKGREGGEVRLMRSGVWKKVAPGDIEYRYVVSFKDGLHVEIYAVDYRTPATRTTKLQEPMWSQRCLYAGPLDQAEPCNIDY